MKVIHRAILTIAVCFLTFGGYAISTRLSAGVPPTAPQPSPRCTCQRTLWSRRQSAADASQP